MEQSLKFQKKIQKEIEKTPQNCYAFVKKGQNLNKLILRYNPSILMKNFLSYHFLPWTNPFAFASLEDIKYYLDTRILRFREKPGWGVNKKPNPSGWVKDVIENISLNSFPNCNKSGIIISSTHLRSLPTTRPHFTDWTSPGEGYPFDNIQISYLAAYQPIHLLHLSKNKQWALILTSQIAIGWVKMEDIAFIDKKTQKKLKTKKYIVPIVDCKTILGKTENVYLSNSRLGQLLPLYKEGKEYYEIVSFFKNEKGFAAAQIGKISKKFSRIAPVPFSLNNFINLANSLLNEPYGWGEIYGLRDCSSTLRDLYNIFGLFIPRNSKWQNEIGNQINLKGLKLKEKMKVIIEKGIPFLTLVYFPGHIMLYVGHKNGVPYIYNTIWGLKVKGLFSSESRAIIGKNLIMPLNLGKKHGDIKLPPIDKLTSISILDDNLKHSDLINFKNEEIYNPIDILESGYLIPKTDIKLKEHRNINKLIKCYGKQILNIKLNRKINEVIFTMKDGKQIKWNLKNTKNKNLNYLNFNYEVKYPILKPKINYNPGREVNESFFESIYGGYEKEVVTNIVKVRWLPKTNINKPKFVMFNKKCGGATALYRVSRQLDRLPEELKKYVTNISLNTKEQNLKGKYLSNKLYIAIELEKKYRNYWENDDYGDKIKFINRVPYEIVKIFEQNGFIWGGRWHNFDTGHFEYRPEMFI